MMSKDFAAEVGEFIIVGLFVLGLLTVVGVVGFQVYIFLHDGVWHWLTVADVMVLAGKDPQTILNPSQHWEWVGVGRVVNWLFYTKSVVFLVVGLLAAGYGLIGAIIAAGTR